MDKSLQAVVQTEINESISLDQTAYVSNLLTGQGTFSDIRGLIGDPLFHKTIKEVERHDLLPNLFSIRNEPYSIVDYPQFQPMYAKAAPTSLTYLCGRQIAKTTNLSRSEVMDMITIPNFQILYVAPLKSQADRYGKLYLYETVQSCELASAMQDDETATTFGEGPVIKSVEHKAFSNGAGIQLMYAKTSADRARGVTADRIDFDEVQDQLIDHIPIIEEAATNSDWDLKRYTGTAKTTDNTIEHYWRQSSMAEWAVPCGTCGHWNIPDKDHDVLAMIHMTGPVCTKCRKRGVITRLNVRAGDFIHGIPSRASSHMGVHVPQIVVPAITENKRKWRKLISKIARLPEAMIYTEILGISCDSGARLLTWEDVEQASTLPSVEVLRTKLDDYTHRVVGVDWGVAEISSFTVATVLGMNRDGKIHVLFIKRYIATNMEDVLKDILHIYHAYSCDMIAADAGAGLTNNTLLMNYGARISQVNYVTANTFMHFKADANGAPKWCVDRNTALTLMFCGLKHGSIFLPPFEDNRDYTRDLLAVYEDVQERSPGIKNKVYRRDPKNPDDFCHALTFGVCMLLQLTGSNMLNLVPTHSYEYIGDKGGDLFPEQDQVDFDAVLQNLRDS